MAESMKDFEKEIDESFKNLKSYNDPDAGKWETFRKYKDEKQVHKVKITQVVKGGCVAFLDEVRAFIPASQLSDTYVDDIEVYQNKNIEVVVITVDEENKKLVLSHRELEKAKKAEKKAESLNKINIGDVIVGKVESLQSYGAFVELAEGITGLLHISQISHNRIKHPGVVLKEGEEVKVQVIGKDENKISLSKKVLEEVPGEYKNDEEEIHEYKDNGRAETLLGDLLKNFKFDN